MALKNLHISFETGKKFMSLQFSSTITTTHLTMPLDRSSPTRPQQVYRACPWCNRDEKQDGTGCRRPLAGCSRTNKNNKTSTDNLTI